jgi:hypothetical protein
MNTYNNAKVSLHHRLLGHSYQNAASATVANAVNILQHNEHIPQHHGNAALLAPRIGGIAAS